MGRSLALSAFALLLFACSRREPPAAVVVGPAPAASTCADPATPDAPPTPPPPPAPTAAATNDREADDVREATFRHMFKKNASGQQQKSRVYCLDVENAAPAPAAFVARFRDVKIPVKPGSACDRDASSGVIDRATGNQGLVFRIDTLSFADAEHATVHGGYYEAGLSASGNIYTLEKKNGHWVVTKDEMSWIS